MTAVADTDLFLHSIWVLAVHGTAVDSVVASYLLLHLLLGNRLAVQKNAAGSCHTVAFVAGCTLKHLHPLQTAAAGGKQTGLVDGPVAAASDASLWDRSKMLQSFPGTGAVAAALNWGRSRGEQCSIDRGQSHESQTAKKIVPFRAADCARHSEEPTTVPLEVADLGAPGQVVGHHCDPRPCCSDGHHGGGAVLCCCPPNGSLRPFFHATYPLSHPLTGA